MFAFTEMGCVFSYQEGEEEDQSEYETETHSMKTSVRSFRQECCVDLQNINNIFISTKLFSSEMQF